ncbi:hypothetical protein [Nakamurella lactea]|uniref:hypothetical protein n=1 Tax=Nakamurella lactea TaxID=459515 RepID=UPI0004199231|nr:hypothetical protein [Nakamurella lactea]
MRSRYWISAAALVLTLQACGASSPGASDAPRVAGGGAASAGTMPAGAPAVIDSAATGSVAGSVVGGVVLDDEGGSAGPQLCALFTAAEVGGWLGESIVRTEVAGPLNSACYWHAAGDGQAVMITAALPQFYAEPGDDSTVLTGIADAAYSGPGMLGDKQAAALLLDRFTIVVSVGGVKDAEPRAVTVLRAIVQRIAPGYEPAPAPADPAEIGARLCAVATVSEVAGYLGGPVGAGQVDGASCRWQSADGAAALQVSVGPEGSYQPPEGLTDYRVLGDAGPGIERAYTAPSGLGYWDAVALVPGVGVATVSVRAPADAVGAATRALRKLVPKLSTTG